MALLDRIKDAFRGSSTPSEKKRNISLDLITSDLDNIPSGALASLWEQQAARYRLTEARIRKVRSAMVGETRPRMAPEWDLTDREDLRADGPDKYIRPRQTARRLASKKAEIKRPASGLTPTAQKNSSRIEASVNAFLEESYPDVEVIELLLNEAECCVLMLPASCAWESIPTLYDEMEEDEPFASADDYEALSPSKRREYERANPSDQQPVYKRIRQRYRRNADGEKDSGKDGYATDLKQTAKAFEEELTDAYARRIPVTLRVVSRLDYQPLNPRFSGKRLEVDGVIVRTLYRRSVLARDYSWAKQSEGLLEPIDSQSGADGELYLYELYAYDEEHRPFVAFQVGTDETQWDNDGTTAVVKLWSEYPGVTELPVAIAYGQHTAAADPDKRTLPMPYPYLQNWSQRDSVLTQVGISIAQSGYPTWGQKLDKESLEVMNSIEGDIPLEFVMRPNAVQPLIGDLVELTSKGTNQDVKVFLEALQALNTEDLPSAGAFGGEGPTSGLDRQVLGRDMEVAYGDVIAGGLSIKETCGRMWLMLASAIGNKAGQPVTLYSVSDGTQPQGAGQTVVQTRIELPPDLCGDNWDVIGRFPSIPGENLAANSLLLNALGQGAILMREWRELGMGDQHPEQFAAELALETYFQKTPAGQIDLILGMAEFIRDDRITKMVKLAADGKLTDQMGGVSAAAMQDLLGAGQQSVSPENGSATAPMVQAQQSAPPGPSTGLSLPNPGAASLAGGNAGAIQADAASAGSPMDPSMGRM